MALRGLAQAEGDLLLFHYAGFSRSLAHVARFRGRRGPERALFEGA